MIILILPQAVSDIAEAKAYYESQSAGLGIRFSDEVKKSIDTLMITPYFQLRYENVRCLPLRSFPFMIHYTIDEQEQEIFIHAVLHTSRNPEKYWVIK